jgi:cytochrome c biogenesis protein CcmG, thiol:disulfide interchange protein DsbE
MAPASSPSASKRPVAWAAFVPIALFLALAGLFVWAMFGSRVDRHASPLIDKPTPNFVLPDMAGGTLDLASYAGKPIILNFYASWCAPCRVEHPQLLQLSKDSRFVVLGVAYRDDPAKTGAYLEELGNPYKQSAIDRQGATGV